MPAIQLLYKHTVMEKRIFQKTFSFSNYGKLGPTFTAHFLLTVFLPDFFEIHGRYPSPIIFGLFVNQEYLELTGD